MAKRMDEQILSLSQKDYWTTPQFKKGELRKFTYPFEPNSYRFNSTDKKDPQRQFDVGDVVIVLQTDLEVENDLVECMTRYGFMRLRSVVLAQYTVCDESAANE